MLHDVVTRLIYHRKPLIVRVVYSNTNNAQCNAELSTQRYHSPCRKLSHCGIEIRARFIHCTCTYNKKAPPYPSLQCLYYRPKHNSRHI